jgi:hypothetical protein
MTRADYKYYDEARRADGRVKGLEVAGLFLNPLASKVRSWTMGSAPPEFRCDNPKQEALLNAWMGQHWAKIANAYEEAVALGDYFMVVNADLSISLVTPDVVEPVVDEDDYSKIIGWEISERFDKPNVMGQYMMRINTYTETERVLEVGFSDNQTKKAPKFKGRGGQQIEMQRQVYPNLTGRGQCVHVVNNRRSNEVFGSPEGAALVAHEKGLLHRYGEILDAGTDGYLKQGRSTPVFKFADQAAANHFVATYGGSVTAQKYNPDTGQVETEVTPTLDFDSDKAVQLVGAGSDFYWRSPDSSAGDMQTILNILYWLFLEHVEIPEFVMGTAIQGSQASANTQMPIFIKWIEKKRGQINDWLLELAMVASEFLALVNPGMGEVSEVSIVWEELTTEDGELTQKFVQWAYAEGLISKEWSLMLAPVKVEDIPQVVADAEAERQTEQDRMDARQSDFIRNGQGSDGEEMPDNVRELYAA